MRLRNHIILSASLGAVLYGVTRSPLAAGCCFVAGVLLDADHLLDFWMYKKRITFGKEIFQGFYKKFGKVYIWFHSFEFLVPLAIMTYFFRLAGLGLTVGFLSHLISDSLSYELHPLSYCLTYRIAKGFDLSHICREDALDG